MKSSKHREREGGRGYVKQAPCYVSDRPRTRSWDTPPDADVTYRCEYKIQGQLSGRTRVLRTRTFRAEKKRSRRSTRERESPVANNAHARTHTHTLTHKRTRQQEEEERASQVQLISRHAEEEQARARRVLSLSLCGAELEHKKNCFFFLKFFYSLFFSFFLFGFAGTPEGLEPFVLLLLSSRIL